MRHPPHTPDPERAFTALYRALYPDLVRFVQRRAHPDHAEDVAAEALLVVWRRLDEVPRAHDDARAWVFGITRHVLLNEQRGAHRRDALRVRLTDTATLPLVEAETDAVLSRMDVARAWGLLSEVHQEALCLAVLDDLSAPRAAAVLGISPVAFRLRLSRARRALRLHLDHPPHPAGRPVATAPRCSERTTSS